MIGLGGLGHMGVKFAAALGAEVTVLSRSDAKADDSRALGATSHVATADRLNLKPLRGTFDVVLNTVSADLDLNVYVGLLKPLGTLVNVGMPPSAWAIKPGSIIGGSRVVAGSNIGGIQATQDMLDFCAEKGIGASIETIAASDVDAAYERVVAGDVRYRFVIDTATIQA